MIQACGLQYISLPLFLPSGNRAALSGEVKGTPRTAQCARQGAHSYTVGTE